MRRTALHGAHRAAAARLVEFAGWEMPLHYGSQIEEHHAVRRDAGVFDVSHMLALDISGQGARALLERALANDVARLRTPGQALYSCMLAEDGGILDDLIVYRRSSEERYRVVLNAGTAESDLAWLESLRPAGVALEPRRDLALLAVQGPAAREKFWAAFPDLRPASEGLGRFACVETDQSFVARTGYTGEDGFELMLPGTRAEDAWRKLFAAGARPCGLGARDTLRLEAGMNLYGQDMDRAVTPLECGLAWTVAREGGRDFVGRRSLERRAPAARLLGLVLAERGGVLRAHQAVRGAHGEGTITSGSFSPTLGTSIGLARVPLASRPGDRVEARVRERALAARLVQPPFVRNGRILV